MQDLRMDLLLLIGGFMDVTKFNTIYETCFIPYVILFLVTPTKESWQLMQHVHMLQWKFNIECTYTCFNESSTICLDIIEQYWLCLVKYDIFVN